MKATSPKLLIFALAVAAQAAPPSTGLKNAALEALNGVQEIVFCTRPLCQCHLMYATFGEYADELRKRSTPRSVRQSKANANQRGGGAP